MGGGALIGCGRDGLERERPIARHGGIDEDHLAAAEEVERVLDLQLEVGEQLDAWQGHGLEPLDRHRADRVVPPAWVADADDQHGRHRAVLRHPQKPHRSCESFTRESMQVPSASISSIRSGILPRACVAHDRQGSKARIATSM